jgi:predicted DNA binding CopG/RHH family protein
MISKSTKVQDIEEIAQQAHSGVDVSEHFTGQFQAKQTISLDLPLVLLRRIDAECAQQNIDRQTWIKQACEKIAEQPQ